MCQDYNQIMVEICSWYSAIFQNKVAGICYCFPCPWPNNKHSRISGFLSLLFLWIKTRLLRQGQGPDYIGYLRGKEGGGREWFFFVSKAFTPIIFPNLELDSAYSIFFSYRCLIRRKKSVYLEHSGLESIALVFIKTFISSLDVTIVTLTFTLWHLGQKEP